MRLLQCRPGQGGPFYVCCAASAAALLLVSRIIICFEMPPLFPVLAAPVLTLRDTTVKLGRKVEDLEDVRALVGTLTEVSGSWLV